MRAPAAPRHRRPRRRRTAARRPRSDRAPSAAAASVPPRRSCRCRRSCGRSRTRCRNRPIRAPAPVTAASCRPTASSRRFWSTETPARRLRLGVTSVRNRVLASAWLLYCRSPGGGGGTLSSPLSTSTRSRNAASGSSVGENSNPTPRRPGTTGRGSRRWARRPRRIASAGCAAVRASAVAPAPSRRGSGSGTAAPSALQHRAAGQSALGDDHDVAVLIWNGVLRDDGEDRLPTSGGRPPRPRGRWRGWPADRASRPGGRAHR